jgi:protein TonB
VFLLVVLALLVAAPASAGPGAPAGTAPGDSARSALDRARRAAGLSAPADSSRHVSPSVTPAVADVAATAPPDSAQRIPGTPFRLGASTFAAAARGLHPGVGNDWQGTSRFFGIESDATLTFAPTRLGRAHFTVSHPSPAQVTYVQDQLRAMGYRRRCQTDAPGSSVCDWTGATLVHLQVSDAALEATVTKAVPAPIVVTPAVPIAKVVTPVVPQPRKSVAPTHQASPPPAPDTTASAPADTAANAGPGPVAAQEPIRHVPVLPETLGVPLPGRTSPYAIAGVRDEWRPLYPPAARRAGIQGRVWVIALVDTSGRVLEAEIERGIPELNAAALDGLRHWRLERRTWQGEPCRYRVEIPVSFRLY